MGETAGQLAGASLLGRHRSDGNPHGLEEHRLLAVPRRERLQQFIRRHRLTPGGWARLAGLPTANALYNFLNGRTASLSPLTLQRLANALNLSPEDIMQTKTPVRLPPLAARQAQALVNLVPLRALARAGLWRRSYQIPAEKQREIAVPNTVLGTQPLVLDEAVELTDSSADQLYPPQSLLLVQRLGNPAGRQPVRGDAVVVVRLRQRGSVVEQETTIRQIGAAPLELDAKAALVWRSHNKRHIGAVPIPWPLPLGEFSNPLEPDSETGRTRYLVVGLVQAALQPPRRRPGRPPKRPPAPSQLSL